MTFLRLLLAAGCCILLLCCGATGADKATKPGYTLQRLPPLDREGTGVVKINSKGEMAGNVTDTRGLDRAFLWHDGRMELLGTVEGYPFNSAMDMNDSGDVVGRAIAINKAIIEVSVPFVYRKGKIEILKTLAGDIYGGAYAVNNRGQIVGFSHRDIGVTVTTHAFLYSNGEVRDLRSLGGAKSVASDVNEKGQIVGYSEINRTDGTRHAVLFDGAKPRDLGTLGGADSAAMAINDAGQIVGWAALATGENHAFLWSRGKMTDLGTLKGHDVSEAYDINALGDVVGRSYKSDKVLESARAFLYRDGRMVDLNDLVPADSGWVLTGVGRFNSRGQVLVSGTREGLHGGCLLSPK